MDSNDPLGNIAKKNFNIDYLFPYQRLVISNILEASEAEGFAHEPEKNPVTGEFEIYDTRPNQIVILPTGAGKSLCFMLPAVLLPGLTIVVFPLLSLIADQERRLTEAGINSGILRGGQSKVERDKLWNNVESGSVKFLLTNPETILKSNMLLKLKKFTVSHIVIDETHTVSEWGDTFRPVYLELSKLTCGFDELDIQPVVTAFTATASDKILKRVKEIIFPGKSPELIAANPDRPNISYKVIHAISKNSQLTELLTVSGEEAYGFPVLIFSRSRTGTELTAQMLRERLGRDNIFFYHAGLDREEKKIIEEWFFDSHDGILIATCAYGMGVDKKNIRTVIHMEPPLTVEAYLQESGRAGRDREMSKAVLLVSERDIPETKSSNNQETISESDSRYRDFITAFTNNSKCRRESLLSQLGAESESCFGCDVCDKTVQSKIYGQNEILSLIKKYNRKLTIREAALTLKGSRYSDVFEKNLFKLNGYGVLSKWPTDDIKNAIRQIELEGIIKIPIKGFYSNRLCLKKRLIHKYGLNLQ